MSLIQRFRNAEASGIPRVELRGGYLGDRYLRLVLPCRFHLAIGISRTWGEWNVHLGPLVLVIERAD